MIVLLLEEEWVPSVLISVIGTIVLLALTGVIRLS
jgi:hypothetical protein